MSVQVIRDTAENVSGITYRTVHLSTERQSLVAIVATGKTSYIRVIVQNAAHKAYRGFGKQFTTIQAALANYKNADIRAMLGYLQEEGQPSCKS